MLDNTPLLGMYGNWKESTGGGGGIIVQPITIVSSTDLLEIHYEKLINVNVILQNSGWSHGIIGMATLKCTIIKVTSKLEP